MLGVRKDFKPPEILSPVMTPPMEDLQTQHASVATLGWVSKMIKLIVTASKLTRDGNPFHKLLDNICASQKAANALSSVPSQPGDKTGGQIVTAPGTWAAAAVTDTPTEPPVTETSHAQKLAETRKLDLEVGTIATTSRKTKKWNELEGTVLEIMPDKKKARVQLKISGRDQEHTYDFDSLSSKTKMPAQKPSADEGSAAKSGKAGLAALFSSEKIKERRLLLKPACQQDPRGPRADLDCVFQIFACAGFLGSNPIIP